MFSRRAPLFTKPCDVNEMVKSEAKDLLDRRNDQRKPLNEVIANIHRILDWIGYEELPEPVSMYPPSAESSQSASSSTDSDVIML